MQPQPILPPPWIAIAGIALRGARQVVGKASDISILALYRLMDGHNHICGLSNLRLIGGHNHMYGLSFSSHGRP
jgi:hypothetical protein